MVKTQIQLPESLYKDAKRVAREREMSFSEVVRRGIEYITRTYPPLHSNHASWKPPAPRSLGAFRIPVEGWRLAANESESEQAR
ncbi:MAG: antitoxin [Acidobacteriota bacterium]|jgi:hypothetical protein